MPIRYIEVIAIRWNRPHFEWSVIITVIIIIAVSFSPSNWRPPKKITNEDKSIIEHWIQRFILIIFSPPILVNFETTGIPKIVLKTIRCRNEKSEVTIIFFCLDFHFQRKIIIRLLWRSRNPWLRTRQISFPMQYLQKRLENRLNWLSHCEKVGWEWNRLRTNMAYGHQLRNNSNHK